MTMRKNVSARRPKDAPPPKTPPGEKATLVGFLDYLRDAVVAKVEGAPEPAVREPGVDSGTNLLGLVKHLGHVELAQFLGEAPSSWPKTFRPTAEDTVESLVAAYREAIGRADEALAAHDDLDEPLRPTGPPLRWVLTHTIEETGRHAGQMDILRERIDGATGR